MRKTCRTSRRDRFACPLCEVGELLPSGQGSARCTSCASFVSRTMLEVLQRIVALPDSLGNHACEECGHPWRSRSPPVAGTDSPLLGREQPGATGWPGFPPVARLAIPPAAERCGAGSCGR